MKTIGGFWLTLIIVGLLSTMIMPAVSAETYEIGTKVSESEIDHRDMKLVNFESGSKLYIEPDFINNISMILDGDESTGINYNFGPSHEQMFFELIFPEAYYVSNITVKPAFGGGATAYTLYINSDSVYSPWLAQDITTQKTFYLNCSIIGIWFWLDSNGTNHYYFNDIIINYNPSESFQNQISILSDQINELDNEIENLNSEISITNNEIDNLTTQINALDNEIEDLDSEVEKLEQEVELEIQDIFLEPPFLGFLWIVGIIALILSIRKPKPMQLQESDETTELADEPLPPPPPYNISQSDNGKTVKGRFCPNCNKYTEEKGPFCPFCKRSMI